MDFNKYWIVPGEDDNFLIDCVENYEPSRFYVGQLGTGSFSRPTKHDFNLNNNLELKVLKKGYLFKIGDEEIFLEKHPTKSFSIRENPLGSSCLDYLSNNKEYLKIYLGKKVELEPADEERAPGIPFYRIKKS